MSASDPLVAELTVAEVEARLAAGRARVASYPVILVLLGVVDVGGAGMSLLVGRDHLLAYFVPAQALAFVLAYRWHRRQAVRTGVQPVLRPWIVTAVVVSIAAAAGSRLGYALDNDRVTTSAPNLAYAFGYFLLARWAGSRILIVGVMLMPLVTLVAVASLNGDVAVAAQLGAFGAILFAAAALTRQNQRD